MNHDQIEAVNWYLKTTNWSYYPGNKCWGVCCGSLSYYFFFSPNNTIKNVILD